VSRPLSVVIHGHYYQPPRENPWLDVVEREPSAAPFHDWNQRIDRECYRAVAAARRYASDGRISDIVNTLAATSFDFGPTLLEWMEHRAPRTYAAVLDADRVSRAAYDGHGNAIAMPYHHTILPLASRRDKVTEVRWGIADFRRRFGREPEGMWLPETAVDPETLDVLAAEGIRFTILAPHQVTGAPTGGYPGWYRTPSGRAIALFVYDGPISHDVAFGGLLRDAARWAERVLAPDDAGRDRALVSVATDGETYGHHQHFGEVALAWLLGDLERRGVRVENCAAFLARHPAEQEVQLVSPSSWSCPHGVERWRSDCGCRIAPERPTNQRWRAPLRKGLEDLATGLHAVFEREGPGLFSDPWAAREGYGTVVASDSATVTSWVAARADRAKDAAGRIRAGELLELERNALRMFTSCGWFFDDIAGIEAQQVLRYAARAIELAELGAPALETRLLDTLATAQSNDPAAGTGATLYRTAVKPKHPAPLRVAAAAAAWRTLVPTGAAPVTGYTVSAQGDRYTVTHLRTGRAYAFDATVEHPEAARFVCHVTTGEASTTLELGDLPETARDAIRSETSRVLVKRCFSPEEARALAAGDVTLPRVSARALLRAVSALERDQSAGALALVSDLTDLLALVGDHIPFDVQTVFARLRDASSPETRARLAPVAWRLGFTEDR